MLFSYPNVWNTCLLILRERGYHLYIIDYAEDHAQFPQYRWYAEKVGFKFQGANPIELLGLVTIYDYHQPAEDKPYWWLVDGPNIVAELQDAWRAKLDLLE